MRNYYNLEGIQAELINRIAREKAILQAWQAVTFPTKKDGSPFKNMAKNISGARYYMDSTAWQPGEYKMSVYTWANGSGYVDSEIKAYEMIKYMKDKTKLAKSQNIQPKQTYLEQIYTYDLDDIKQAIANKISSLQAEIAELENQLAIAPEVFATFRNAYHAAIVELEASSRRSENSSLYYMILETVKASYPRC